MSTSKNSSCVFCDLQNDQNTRIVKKTENWIMIADIRPQSRHHLLVIPLQHLPTIKNLTSKHQELLRDMIDAGEKALTDYGYAPHQQR